MYAYHEFYWFLFNITFAVIGFVSMENYLRNLLYNQSVGTPSIVCNMNENMCSTGLIAMSCLYIYNKGNNKIIELRTILQRESQHS
jgi:hypothetical protein